MANSPGFQPREIRAVLSSESRRDGGAEFHANTAVPSGLSSENNLFPGIETPGYLPPSLREESVQLQNACARDWLPPDLRQIPRSRVGLPRANL